MLERRHGHVVLVAVTLVAATLTMGCLAAESWSTEPPSQSRSTDISRDAGVPAYWEEFMELWELGIAAFRQKDFAQSIHYFEEAVRVEASLPGPWRYLAAIAELEERHEDCVRLAEDALARMPETSRLLDEVAEIRDGCRAKLQAGSE